MTRDVVVRLIGGPQCSDRAGTAGAGFPEALPGDGGHYDVVEITAGLVAYRWMPDPSTRRRPPCTCERPHPGCPPRPPTPRPFPRGTPR